MARWSPSFETSLRNVDSAVHSDAPTDGSPGGLLDLHSHLVPGVDDGARTPEDTSAGLRRMADVGVTEVITTPHFNASWLTDPTMLAAWEQQVSEAWPAVEDAAAQVGLRVRRGHEVALDVPDAEISHPSLFLGDTRILLAEWPRLQVPPGSKAAIGRIVAQGIRPLIAHPERYNGLDSTLSVVADWKEAGAWLQMNYGSPLGRYGPKVKRVALTLLERGWVDVMSSDFHGRSHLKLYIKEARELFGVAEAAEAWHLLSGANARRILAGETPTPPPPLVFPRTWVDRVKGWLGG